jgi:FkbM family methyltransferase
MLISNAQNFEDVILHRTFKMTLKGFYIDIGACFPQEGSVTKMFYDMGWNGINVEPHPKAFAQLQEERVRDINLNIAISDTADILTLYENKSIGETSAVFKEGTPSFDVPALPLRSICKKYVTQQIDFLKIDVEGHEYHVLAGGDWQHYRPKVIICEITLPWTNAKRDDTELIDKFLLSNDYNLAYFDGINNYYIASEHSELTHALAVQPNVIDNYMSFQEFCARSELEALTAQLEFEKTKTAITKTEHDTLRKKFDMMLTQASNFKFQLETLKSQLEFLTTQLKEFETPQLQANKFSNVFQKKFFALHKLNIRYIIQTIIKIMRKIVVLGQLVAKEITVILFFKKIISHSCQTAAKLLRKLSPKCFNLFAQNLGLRKLYFFLLSGTASSAVAVSVSNNLPLTPSQIKFNIRKNELLLEMQKWTLGRRLDE